MVNSSFSSSCQIFFRVATCSKYNESSDCCSPVIYKSSTFPLGLIPRVVFICGRQLKESSRSTTCIKLSTNCIKLSYLIIQSYHPVYLIKTTIPLNMSYTGDNTIYNRTISFYGDNTIIYYTIKYVIYHVHIVFPSYSVPAFQESRVDKDKACGADGPYVISREFCRFCMEFLLKFARYPYHNISLTRLSVSCRL